MLKKLLFITLFILLSYNTRVHADTIYLKNGNKITGIITKEESESIGIDINIGATVTFSRQDIERIERDSDLEQTKIKEEWESEKARKEAEKKEEDAFEEGQRDKGLVDYEGKWVTLEEKERLQAASIAKGGPVSPSHRESVYKKDSKKASGFAKKLLKKGKWLIRETEHFSIFYKDPAQAKIVSDKAEYYFEKIVYDLGYEGEIAWDEKCRVYIVESVEEWKVFFEDIGFNPELAAGGFVPNYEEKEMFLCALSEGYLAVTFPHELTHLIFREIADKSTIPLWLNEGLANYEASLTSVSNELLMKYITKGRHILLGDLLRMTDYPEGKEMRELFYAQSEKLVAFLITQYGREKFRKFCELILKDRSFKDSVLSVYKADFKDLEDFNIKLVEYIVR
ncbi:MAG: hypothetical protein KJ952_02495 [Candidatus Omnitrophica bacterium]|nr:hypothetical protein [Candidatus Omnitrophota bacterium]